MYATCPTAAITISPANLARCFALIRRTRFMVDGTADALARASYVLPFMILAFPVVWLWVWLWRKFVRRRS